MRPHFRALLASQIVVFGTFWAVAFFLLWARPDVRGVRVLAGAVVAVTVGQYFRFAWPMRLDTCGALLVGQVSIVARFLGPILVVYFGLVFPSVWRRRRVIRGVLGTTAALTTLLFLVEEAQFLRGALDPQVPYAYPLATLARLRYAQVRFWVFLGSFLACGGLLVETYLRTSDNTVRGRIKWVVWGVGLAVAADAVAVAVGWYLEGGPPTLHLETYRNYLYLLPAAGITLAVFRHDLFDVDRVIRHTVANVGTMILVFLLFATVESVVSELLEDVLPSAGIIASVLGGVMAAGLFTPLRRWIDGRVRRSAPGAPSRA